MWPLPSTQQRQTSNAEFRLQQEEFPSLSAAVSSTTSGNAAALASSAAGPPAKKEIATTPAAPIAPAAPSTTTTASAAAPGPSIAPGPSSQPPPPATGGTMMNSQQPPVHAPPPPQAMNSVDRFGLLGLLGVIRMTDQDLNTLALGCDLTTLGLNLNAVDPIHTMFLSPWSEHPTLPVSMQNLLLPPCYNVPSVPDLVGKVGQWSEGTLFYVFYAMPGDTLQILAAQELFRRNWRYHQDLKLWLTKDPATTGAPIEKTPTYEKGVYIVWDVRLWTRVTRELVVVYELLEDLSGTAMMTAVSNPVPDGVQTVSDMIQQQQALHVDGDAIRQLPQAPPSWAAKGAADAGPDSIRNLNR